MVVKVLTLVFLFATLAVALRSVEDTETEKHRDIETRLGAIADSKCQNSTLSSLEKILCYIHLQTQLECPLPGLNGTKYCPGENVDKEGVALEYSSEDIALYKSSRPQWLLNWSPLHYTPGLPAVSPYANQTRSTSRDPVANKTKQVKVFHSFDEWAHRVQPNATTYEAGVMAGSNVGTIYRSYFNTSASLVNAYQVYPTLVGEILGGSSASDIPLSIYFARALELLPTNYSESHYSAVLRAYGTQVGMEVHLGGLVQQSSAMRSCAFAGDMPISEYAMLSMNQELFPGRFTQKLNGTFKSYMHNAETRTYGGSERFLVPDKWVKDTSAMKRNPAVTAIKQSRPITDFVSDPLKRANLQKLIEQRTTEIKQEFAQQQEELHEANVQIAQHVMAGYQYNNGEVHQFNLTVKPNDSVQLNLPYSFLTQPYLHCQRSDGPNAAFKDDLQARLSSTGEGVRVHAGCSYTTVQGLRAWCCRRCIAVVKDSNKEFDCKCPSF